MQDCPHIATQTHEYVNALPEVLDEARAQSPIAWDDTHDRYAATRWSTASAILKDWETFSSTCGTDGKPDSPRMPPISVDPPLHRQWRLRLSPFFKPAAIGRLRPAVERITDELIDAFIERGTAELQQELSGPLPGLVFFGEMMGLPVADMERVQEWAEMAVGAHPTGSIADGYAGMGGYVGGLVARRRSEPPRDDLIGTVVHAEMDGELVSLETATLTIMLLIFAGLETVMSTLGSMLWHLARHPDLQDRLRADPDQIPRAIDEMLRLYTPVLNLCREVTRDVEVDGFQLAAGDIVSVNYLAANHDPEQFDDPHVFRDDRSQMHHLGFGYGVHFCLGAHLARLELQVALERLLARTRRFSIAPGHTPHYKPAGVWTLAGLEVTLDAV